MRRRRSKVLCAMPCVTTQRDSLQTAAVDGRRVAGDNGHDFGPPGGLDRSCLLHGFTRPGGSKNSTVGPRTSPPRAVMIEEPGTGMVPHRTPSSPITTLGNWFHACRRNWTKVQLKSPPHFYDLFARGHGVVHAPAQQ